MSNAFPILTVAICTYNRADKLGTCLNSLKRQIVHQDCFDILIIDNNSTDNTQFVIKNSLNLFPHIKAVKEYRQGLSNARNRALKECLTSWIAFLDDDAKAHPDWVSTILTTIQKNDFDAFGGPYYAWHPYGPAPSWLPEDFGTYESPQGYGLLQGDTFIPGGNCVLRSDVARRIGTFSIELGMNGSLCGYGEETQFFERMRTAGYRMGYVPQLKIDHCVLPYKYTLRWQLHSAFISGRDFIRFQHSLGKNVSSIRQITELIKYSIKNIKNFFIHKPSIALFIYTKCIIHRIGCIIESLSSKG